MLFTVPLRDGSTFERAHLRQGVIEHLHAPVYHGDPLREGADILAFRDYGSDIVQRLLVAGFGNAWIEVAATRAVPWALGRLVIGARR